MRVGTIIRNAAADAVADACAGSKLLAYTGARPATLTGTVEGTLLAEYTMGSPAFGEAVAGVLTATAITGGSGLDDGTVGFVRWMASNGTDVLGDLTVGVGSGEVQFNTLTISEGLAVSITGMTFTVPAGS